MADSDLEVKFGADTSGVTRGADEVKGHIEAIGASVEAMEGLLDGLKDAFIEAFAVKELNEFVEGVAKLGLELERTSQILGVTPDQVNVLGLVAKASGSSLESLEMAFGRMNREMIDGSESAKRALDALGLSMAKMKEMNPQEQLETLADKFSGIKDGAEKDAIAILLLGRAGEQLIPFLNEGKEGIEEYKQMSERAGQAIITELLPAMEQLHKETVELNKSIQVDGVAVFGIFRGVIDGAYQIMIDLAQSFSEAIEQGGFLAESLKGVAWVLKAVETAVAGAIVVFKNLWVAGTDMVDGVTLGFMHMGAAIQDIFTALANGIAGFFSGLIEAARNTASTMGQTFVDLGNVIWNALHGNFSEAQAGLGTLTENFKTNANAIGDALKGSVSGFNFKEAENELAAMWKDIDERHEYANRQIAKNDAQFAKEYERIWEDAAKKRDKPSGNDAHLRPTDKGGADDETRAKITAIDAEIDAVKKEAEFEQRITDDLLKNHKISEQQWLATTLQTLDHENDAVDDLYAKELAIEGLKASQHAAILKKMQQDDEQYYAAVQKAQIKAADEAHKEWMKVSDTIASSFSGQVSALLKGTETFGQAFRNIIGDLLTKFIEFCVKMAVQWVLTNTGMETVYASMQTALSGIGASGSAATMAAQKPGIIAAITADVGEVFAGAAAFFAPFLGPAAPAAAAGVASSVEASALSMAAFDRGSWELPGSGVAMVHKGEMIVPASHTPWAQSLMANGGGGGGAGGGDIHLHLNAQAMDAPGVMQLFKNNGSGLAKIVASMFDANPGLRPRFT